ncbi:MAG: hypothetical protein ACRDE5_09515, partial [Ginsengibacter sp.]
SPQSPKLILQVADLLSYILYESDQEYVVLEKELTMIKDYIVLEENTIVGNLPMNIIINGEGRNKEITPLILLSIVEAWFEYFPEKSNGEFTALLNIDINEHHLDLEMNYTTFNNHFFEPFELNEKFASIQKQLNNLYPSNHHFSIESVPGNVRVFLKNLPLHIPKTMQEKLQAKRDTYENA